MALFPQSNENNLDVSSFNEGEYNFIDSLDWIEGESELERLNRHCEALDQLCMEFNNTPHMTQMNNISDGSGESQMTNLSPSQIVYVTHVTQMSPMSMESTNTNVESSHVSHSHPHPQAAPLSNVSSDHDCDIPDELERSLDNYYFDSHNRNLNSLFRRIN